MVILTNLKRRGRFSMEELEAISFLINDLDLVPRSVVTPSLCREYYNEIWSKHRNLDSYSKSVQMEYLADVSKRFHCSLRHRVKSDDSQLLKFNF